MLRWAYKKGREILRRMSMLRAPLLPAHPQFSQDSKAAFAEPGPVPFDAPKITYSAEDDAAIDANVRNMGEPISGSLLFSSLQSCYCVAFGILTPSIYFLSLPS